MKVLLVNDAGTPGGGAEILTLGLRRELRSRGVDARIFASTARYGPGPSEADFSCFGTTSGLRTLNRVVNPSAVFRLREVLRSFRPDVVHVRMLMTQISPAVLPLLRSFPSLYHATWHEAICPNGLKLLPDGTQCSSPAGTACLQNGCTSPQAWPFLMAQQWFFKRWRSVFRLVVANSHYLAGRLTQAGLHPVSVIWNGVDPSPPRLPLSTPPTIAFCGRLIPEKGAQVLLQAVALLLPSIPDLRVVFAGDGPERAALVKLTQALRISHAIHFLGHLPRAQLETEIRHAWVQAVPSICNEAFGLAAAEALMRGTAVVASNLGGLAEIVAAPLTGNLVPPADPNALAQALHPLLSDQALAEQTGAHARLRALQHFSLANCTTAFQQLYARLASTAPHP